MSCTNRGIFYVSLELLKDLLLLPPGTTITQIGLSNYLLGVEPQEVVIAVTHPDLPPAKPGQTPIVYPQYSREVTSQKAVFLEWGIK